MTLATDVPVLSGCLVLTGFAVVVGPLGGLDTSTIGTTPSSAAVASELALDVDGDGDGSFGGVFDGSGKATGFGEDAICDPTGVRPDPRVLAPVESTAVDDTTVFKCFERQGGMTTPPLVASLQDLKDGVPDLGGGVSATTPAAILVELPSEDLATPRPRRVDEPARGATVDSLRINGVQL